MLGFTPVQGANRVRLRRTFKKHSRPRGDVSELAQESRKSVRRERFLVSQSCGCVVYACALLISKNGETL